MIYANSAHSLIVRAFVNNTAVFGEQVTKPLVTWFWNFIKCTTIIMIMNTKLDTRNLLYTSSPGVTHFEYITLNEVYFNKIFPLHIVRSDIINSL